MMLLLGVVIGAVAAKIVRRRFFGGHWRGHWGGGHWRGQRGRWFFRLRRLGLDRQQMDEVERIWREASADLREVPLGRFRAISELLDLAADDTLDQTRLDELAARWTETHARAAHAVTDAVAKLHAVLRPEQRAKLRDLVGGAGYGPTAGPYR